MNNLQTDVEVERWVAMEYGSKFGQVLKEKNEARAKVAYFRDQLVAQDGQPADIHIDTELQS